jgi:hypothetical protein
MTGLRGLAVQLRAAVRAWFGEYKRLRKIVIGMLGASILIIGVFMLVLPGPAVLVVPWFSGFGNRIRLGKKIVAAAQTEVCRWVGAHPEPKPHVTSSFNQSFIAGRDVQRGGPALFHSCRTLSSFRFGASHTLMLR